MRLHPALVSEHRGGFPPGATPVLREGAGDGARDVGVDFSIVKHAAGDVVREAHEKESAWLLMRGRARVVVDGKTYALARASLFDERPSVVHVPARAHVELEATSDVEWALVRAANPRAFAPRVFLPDDVTSEPRGQGLMQESALRIVRLVFDLETRPESALVVGEVINLPGRWSSYPPHHHAQPEMYHYRFTEPQGYGHAELDDDVVKVRDGDTLCIVGGVDHPQCAAPGYGMYYLWVVRHPVDGAPYRGFTFTDDHAWTLDASQQGYKPGELR